MTTLDIAGSAILAPDFASFVKALPKRRAGADWRNIGTLVCFDPAGSIAWTDGRIALRLPFTSSTPFTGQRIVELETLRHACKAFPNGAIEVGADGVRVGMIDVPAIDDGRSFPNVDAVIPSTSWDGAPLEAESANGRQAFNVGFLTDILKVVKATGGKDATTRFVPCADRGPAKLAWRTKGDALAHAVLMPLVQA